MLLRGDGQLCWAGHAEEGVLELGVAQELELVWLNYTVPGWTWDLWQE